jgi:peptidoglycan/xylan/chitin deacetylase (PgdA/CDA1 family)
MIRSIRKGTDAIGCVGTLFLVFIVLFVIGVTLGNATLDSGNATQSAVLPTLVEAAAQITMTATDTATPLPSSTHTSTPTDTSTPTITPSPTETATNTPTFTPSPTPTDGPSPTPTDTPLPPPLPTPFEHYSWTLKVPILMYHYISIPPQDADQYRIDLSVTPENFRAQMAYLVENGYNTIDLYDLSLAIVNKRELPPNPVVPTQFIDSGNPNHLTWEMIEEMAAYGIRFEPHSKTHPDLRDRERDFLIWELLGSQETLAAHLGYTPRYFAYPGGRYDQAVIDILTELDYWAAVTTAGGKWHGFNDRYEWTRMRVRYSYSLAEFADLVE